MSGRILILDSVATNRIVLRAKLLTAQYLVTCASTIADALNMVRSDLADLLIVDLGQPAELVLDFIQTVRTDPATAALPIIAISSFCTPAGRLEALEAGADDILIKPIADGLLQARIRSLLRARDADSELRLRDDTSRALGFAEPAAGFAVPGRIALIEDGTTAAKGLSSAVSRILGYEVQTLDPDSALSLDPSGGVPDVFVIPARTDASRVDVGIVFRLVADLRSRSESRLAAQLIVVPSDTPEIAAMALDLGANDVVIDAAEPAEIAHRIAALLRRKANLDRLRDTVKSGIRAAVTDPLTGLYNRRYALPHLASLAERALADRREFALMVLDIDHFKRINDTYGHASGDKVLVGVAQCLRDNLRAIDLVARIGGEEFLIAMPETTVDQARGAADRLRRLIETATFETDQPGQVVRVTLSIGVAIGGVDPARPEDVTRMVDRADAALYMAKSAGRNTVTISRSAA